MIYWFSPPTTPPCCIVLNWIPAAARSDSTSNGYVPFSCWCSDPAALPSTVARAVAFLFAERILLPLFFLITYCYGCLLVLAPLCTIVVVCPFRKSWRSYYPLLSAWCYWAEVLAVVLLYACCPLLAVVDMRVLIWLPDGLLSCIIFCYSWICCYNCNCYSCPKVLWARLGVAKVAVFWWAWRPTDMFRAIGGCLVAWLVAAEVVVAGWDGPGPTPLGPAVEA